MPTDVPQHGCLTTGHAIAILAYPRGLAVSLVDMGPASRLRCGRRVDNLIFEVNCGDHFSWKSTYLARDDHSLGAGS